MCLPIRENARLSPDIFRGKFRFPNNIRGAKKSKKNLLSEQKKLSIFASAKEKWQSGRMRRS
ncbi:hypothetical protein ED312_05680 [Sinomicrobium pectinilyticum]|uniref:Uncharacterized protein n=1 Tax=Sinomicrobium pectinilyticum TaxID=1084421 RepID=A0A3N0ES24_SINP1|nr:hypothetical protein ED312_05680 [Sinomicrobium pectinilyticum]